MHPSEGPSSPPRGLAVIPDGGSAETGLAALAGQIKAWGLELGFQQVGIADTELGLAESRLVRWLGLGYQGEMGYMARHGTRRSRPAELVPGRCG